MVSRVHSQMRWLLFIGFGPKSEGLRWPESFVVVPDSGFGAEESIKEMAGDVEAWARLSSLKFRGNRENDEVVAQTPREKHPCKRFRRVAYTLTSNILKP